MFSCDRLLPAWLSGPHIDRLLLHQSLMTQRLMQDTSASFSC